MLISPPKIWILSSLGATLEVREYSPEEPSGAGISFYNLLWANERAG